MGFRFAGRWFGRRPASTLENICLATDTSGYPVYINWSDTYSPSARAMPAKDLSLLISLSKLNHSYNPVWYISMALT